MNKGKNNKFLLGTGLLLATSSSLCCIAPVLSIIGGISGAGAAFGWIAPLRPYLLGLMVVTLGFSFYKAYTPPKKNDCGCGDKKSLFQSKKVLWSIAIIAVLLSTFPYYAGYFSANRKQTVQPINNTHLQQVVFHVSGMSCKDCEGHITAAAVSLPGVTQANASYEQQLAWLEFDSTRISAKQLSANIQKETGYIITP
ncbi:copper chaperone CopZ [Chitinophaga niastensis]|uniref:Mercuric transport protein MerT n=1 Tax=Chitinophaga niastensis TaxID=536980 RepID=A0A2P8HHJ9_CHINA|nr:mercuric transport protein MerTP [Chitinophaga niastensis]PSL45705.1 copper chaperone CopZ [Chitinophaga niastensis]